MADAVRQVPGRIHVVLVGTCPPDARPGLAAAIGDGTLVDLDAATAADLRSVNAALVWDFRWTGLAELLARAPQLSWVQAASAGVDHLREALVGRPDIVLTNAAGVYERPMAEYVLGLILAHAKGLSATYAAQRDRAWRYRETALVAGSTLVVVGAGRIGTAVAALAAAVGMDVLGVRRTPAMPPPKPFSSIVGIDALVPTIAQADYVVVTTPATTSTAGLLDSAALRAMKPSAYLINVGRAAVVDTGALVEALISGTIAGAALDVVEDEPLPPGSPLWVVPNLLISPHMSADAHGWATRVVEQFARNVALRAAGRALESRVDPARGY